MSVARRTQIPTRLEDICDPGAMALLVYDMQEGVAGRMPGAEPVIDRVAAVLRAAREAGMPVFFSRHMSLPKEVSGPASLRGGMALARVASVDDYEPAFLRDSPGFPLLSDVEPLPSEAVLDKVSMSFFIGTPLDLALRDLGTVAFAIVGAVLELGIDPTVRHGADLGYFPAVIADACVSLGDPEHTRQALGRSAFWTDSASFIELLSGRDPDLRTGTSGTPGSGSRSAG